MAIFETEKKAYVKSTNPHLASVVDYGQITLIKRRMLPTLYYMPGSAPCRIVLLVAAALDLNLDLKLLDLRAGEHLKPDFLKLNPQHTVPTLVDGDFSLWESRAISKYLVNKYDSEGSLYPSDPQLRALVDQRLDFDLGTLYPRFGQYFYPQIFGGATADEIKYKSFLEAMDFFNSFLKGNEYAAGKQLTLADLSLVATVSTIEAAGIKFDSYPNVVRWYKLVKSTAPGYEDANGKGVDEFRDHVQRMMGKKTEL